MPKSAMKLCDPARAAKEFSFLELSLTLCHEIRKPIHIQECVGVG
jgi:hypothetical protein